MEPPSLFTPNTKRYRNAAELPAALLRRLLCPVPEERNCSFLLLFLSPGKGCCRRVGAKECCQRAALSRCCCQRALPALEATFGPGQCFCSVAVSWGRVL